MINSSIVDPRELCDPENRNGYPPFPDYLIISSERSGLNLVRHAIETLTPYRTPGKVHKYTEGKLYFHRTHDVFSHNTTPGRVHVMGNDGKDRYKKIILLLRDPREIFVRAYGKNLNAMKNYINNLKYFDAFKGEKLLVYYDELIENPSVLEEIFLFFHIENFYDKEKIASLKEASVQWYDKHQRNGSMTKGKKENLTYHQKRLTQEEMALLANLLTTELSPDQLSYVRYWNFPS